MRAAFTLTGVLALLAGSALAESQTELLREEVYNYRVVGKLPAGWKRRGGSLTYTYFVDEIPHAYVHLVRERVDDDLDVAAALQRREAQYRFPGAPKEAKGTIGSVTWGGRKTLLYEFRAKVQGVACYRRVTILFDRSIWYEMIETIYGKPPQQAQQGLDVFRNGFRLLTEPLPEGAAIDAAERTITDKQFGFTITKPQGFVRVAVDPARDPGCRVAFERVAQNGVQHARVRLFEYAVRQKIAPDKWFDIFFGSFSGPHRNVKRAKAKAPEIPGARTVWAERFFGERDKHPVSTLVLIIWGESGRVFVLRLRTQADADRAFAAGLATVVKTLTVS